MSEALYNKYRPKIFAEVVNQNHIKITLQNEIENGKIAQAYLFAGPRGIGKTTIARIFAKSINCTNRKKSEPCGQCENCLAIQSGQSFDLVEIDAASNRGINEIRELREHVKYPPTIGQYKVFIIDEAHMLTAEAFNALLKTLEEPPKHVIFVLATTEIHKLPETIISRCQRFDFKKVKIDDIAKLLRMIVDYEKVKITPLVLDNIARHSEGYVRDAVGILGQILGLNQEEITDEEAALVLPHSDFKLVVDLTNLLFKKDLSGAIDLINRLVSEGIELDNFINDFLEYLRKLLIIKIMGSVEAMAWELDKKFVQEISEQAGLVTLEELLKVIDLILIKNQAYKYSKIIQLPLEIMAAEIVMLLGREPVVFSPNALKIPGFKKESDKLPGEGSVKNNETPKVDSLKLEELGKNCPMLLDELKKVNHSLSAFFKNSRPISLIDNVLLLGFQYKFQQERINEIKNKKLIEDAINKICGKNILIQAVVDDQYSERPAWLSFISENNNELNQLAEEFGGEVVI